MNKIAIRKLVLRLVLSIVIVSGIAAVAHSRYADSATDCRGKTDPQSPANGARVSYQCGTVNGLKLAIPTYYLMNHIVYVGDLRDGTGPASAANTEKSVIDNFGILLRLSTLQPMMTENDRHDWYAALAKPMFSTTWMMVSLDNHYSVYKNPAPYQSRMLPDAGPFDLDENKEYGLVHYESIQSIDEGDRKFNGHTEYFFGDSTQTTIMCRTHRELVPPFGTFDICSHRFLIPSLNLMGEAFYTKKDLHQWRQIEYRVNEIAHSFIYQ